MGDPIPGDRTAPQWRCLICDKALPDKRSLISHTKTAHKDYHAALDKVLESVPKNPMIRAAAPGGLGETEVDDISIQWRMEG